MWVALHAAALALATNEHRYYALRHGESIPNTRRLICSRPGDATRPANGLSDRGKLQAADAAADVVRIAALHRCAVAVCTSDFARAAQTADAVHRALVAHDIPRWPEDAPLVSTGLRERGFGDLDGGGDDAYPLVWEMDAVDADHREWGVESVNSVRERARSVVERLAAEPALARGRWIVVLVAHGDVLQIAETWFRNRRGEEHRSLEHLPVATLRELELRRGE